MFWIKNYVFKYFFVVFLENVSIELIMSIAFVIKISCPVAMCYLWAGFGGCIFAVASKNIGD